MLIEDFTRLMLVLGGGLQIFGVVMTLRDIVRESDRAALERITMSALMRWITGAPSPGDKVVRPGTAAASLRGGTARLEADAMTVPGGSVEDRVERLEHDLKELRDVARELRRAQDSMASRVTALADKVEADVAELRRLLKESLTAAAVAQLRGNLRGPGYVLLGLALVLFAPWLGGLAAVVVDAAARVLATSLR